MKKKLNRAIVVLLCALMVISLVACSTTPATSGDPSSSPNVSDPATSQPGPSDEIPANQEKMTISIASWNIQDAFEDPNAPNDEIYKLLCEKLNIEIEPVQITWNDWEEKVKIWAASEQLPDMFANALGSELYKKWAQQKVIKALPDDLSAYPNVEAYMALGSVQPLRVDGKFYAFPRGDSIIGETKNAGSDRLIYYRKDWAADAGFTTAPDTFAGYIEMCEAVQALHPEATPIAVNNRDALNYLAVDIEPCFIDLPAWKFQNDQWVPAFMTDKGIEIIERFQGLFTKGLLDQDFAVQKDGDAVTKYLSGRAFSLVRNMMGADQMVQFMDANPDVSNLTDAIGIIPTLKMDDGSSYYFASTPYWSETYFSYKIDDAKMDRCLQLLDYMCSDEFVVLKNNGIEGIDWEMQGDKPVSLLSGDTTLKSKYPIGAEFGYFAAWNNEYRFSKMAVVDSNPQIAAINEQNRLVNEQFLAQSKPIPTNFNVYLMDNELKAKNNGILGSNFMDGMVNIIVGKGNVTEAYGKLIDELNAQGLQEMINAVTNQATEEGIQP